MGGRDARRKGNKVGTSWLLRRVACAVLIALGVLALPVSAASAEGIPVFNAQHSLTGTCETSSVDLIADPGCPGGVHPGPFIQPTAVTTDAYGDVFLANLGPFNQSGEREPRIDVFSPSGILITTFDSAEGLIRGPVNIAVDSECNLYVVGTETDVAPTELRRYPPKECNPAGGKIEYGAPPVSFAGNEDLSHITSLAALAVGPGNELFVNQGQYIVELKSAAEGNEEVERFGSFVDIFGHALAIDAKHGLIYVSDFKEGNQSTGQLVVKALELQAPHAVVGEINGSCTPSGRFLANDLSVGVDEGTGNIFVYDGNGTEVIYELSASGECLAMLDHELKGHHQLAAQIAVDNGEHSPNGALREAGRYLYVPAYPTGNGHLFAFGPSEFEEPAIKSIGFSSVSEAEALLQAEVEPHFLDTTYRFEYTTKESYEEEGFEGASVAAGGQILAGSAPVSVSAVAGGLTPGTVYRFRIVAENELGSDGAEGEFATYPEPAGSPPCPNDAFRTGPSALLPDCRAYELVTPPSTNARNPTGVGHAAPGFATREASPAGDEVSLTFEGGALPGNEGTGGGSGDPYLVQRTAVGWHASYVGPTALESPGGVLPGSNSPDQGYAFWFSKGGEGTANVEGESTSYLRYPDGHSALLGRGALAADPFSGGKLISEGGGHVIFESSMRLEEDAPGGGTRTVYDRTIASSGEEETHVISLLPDDLTPAVGEDASYEGASLDGKGAAFRIGNSLYLRYQDEKSFNIGENVKFAGLAEGGALLFYLQGGDLYRFDAISGKRTRFTTSGNVIPVNVAAAGTVAYFISPSVLTSKPNPNGVRAKSAAQNLYRSEEGEVNFVGTVTQRDVEGESSSGSDTIDGLGLWAEVVGPGRLGADPSRSTVDGSVLLFESRAALDRYKPEGHTEVYRYDFGAETLACLSCNSTLASPTGEASLESVSMFVSEDEPFSSYGFVTNLTPDGRRAFFQSTEALVPADTDGLQDVYEWEAQGVGTCEQSGGCLFLISGGHSLGTDYLYAVSDSGNDVFFRSADFLLGSDLEETPSIYDARVGGGFPEPAAGEACEGEGCRPGLSSSPSLPTPGMLPGDKLGSRRPHCRVGKRKARRHGKLICVKRKHKHHHRKAGKRKGAGK
jgi:hypothetical protein